MNNCKRAVALPSSAIQSVLGVPTVKEVTKNASFKYCERLILHQSKLVDKLTDIQDDVRRQNGLTNKTCSLL